MIIGRNFLVRSMPTSVILRWALPSPREVEKMCVGNALGRRYRHGSFHGKNTTKHANGSSAIHRADRHCADNQALEKVDGKAED